MWWITEIWDNFIVYMSIQPLLQGSSNIFYNCGLSCKKWEKWCLFLKKKKRRLISNSIWFHFILLFSFQAFISESYNLYDINLISICLFCSFEQKECVIAWGSFSLRPRPLLVNYFYAKTCNPALKSKRINKICFIKPNNMWDNYFHAPLP